MLKISEQSIHNTIVVLRGKRVIIDSDLAVFYGTATKRLNEQVRRNSNRFPDDFMFKLTVAEKEYVVANCDHLRKLRFSPYLPYAFTEHGAVMAANVLNSEIAVQASIQVVRVFNKITEILATHKELAAKVEKLKYKLEKRLNKHDNEIQILFETIKQMLTPEPVLRKQVGYKYGEKK